MSVGKTMASYVAGHAICGGYIDSINSRLNDWPLIENTLYYDQKLIDLLNMQAGDEKYVWSSDFLLDSNLLKMGQTVILRTYHNISLTLKIQKKVNQNLIIVRLPHN